MILVAESLNIMSQTIGPAIRERNAGPVQEIAKAQVSHGADYLDINIGPARKNGDEMMEWVVNTVQEVTDLPLSLDTTNPVAMEAGLKACNKPALINSISLQPDRLESELPLVSKYNADMIGLLWGVDGMPRDANERCMHAVDIVYRASELGTEPERIWIDPIASPISVEINQVKACVEFMAMLADVAPGCKSIVGLSNVSNGTPADLRGILNRTYMVMLGRYGLYSAIVDVFDEELVKIARGQMPEIVEIIYKAMDGEIEDLSSINEKEMQYAKTVRVLKGESLYSHSWLEI
ncbi:MAG: dihydropteroate synthase [Dehalococcoidales bacterium]|nr:dihydropteroate synthase [Dehalococcoidales bacterium]